MATIIKTTFINHDAQSGIYTLAPNRAEPTGNCHVSAKWSKSHSAGTQSLSTGGHTPFGMYYLVDITDWENCRIVGTEPIDPSATNGEETSTVPWSAVVPPGCQSLSELPSDKVGAILNCGFRDSGDDVLRGIHNNGATSLWGASYGHTLSHAFTKASEMASVQTFVVDSLTRIKGTNLQLWTALGERDISTSGDTATETVEETHLIHESLGRNSKEEHYDIHQGLPDDEEGKEHTLLKTTKAQYSKLLEDEANEGRIGVEARLQLAKIRERYEQYQDNHPQILPRHVKLSGYLGHGEIDQVVKATANARQPTNPVTESWKETGLPDEAGFNTEYTEQHVTPKIPAVTGLSEVQRASDGRVRITSAKSVSLVKEITIPVPVRIATHAPTTSESFDVDQITEIEITDPQESAELFDRKELYNRSMDRRVVEKHPEWTYPSIPSNEEDEYNGDVLAKAIAYKEKEAGYVPKPLLEHTYEIPTHVTMEIDEQTKSKYYKGRAGVFITEDGGIVIRDAYGSSIRMTGGNIYADCPGDILEMPGRDKVTIAGRGVSLQAQQDVEVVSTNGNARLKAATQLSMLGGSSGSGGVLIESKATDKPKEIEGQKMLSGGIVVKSGTHVNISAKHLGIEAKTAIKSELAVEASIYSPHVYGKEVHTTLLQAADGEFGGRSMFSAHNGTPSLDLGPDETGTIIKAVDDGKGFIAPNITFSFNSSKEYGLELSNYKFELIEPIWQSRERMTEVAKTAWKLNTLPGVGADFQQPYPGHGITSAATIKQPKVTDAFKANWNPEENPTEEAFTPVTWAEGLRVNSGIPADGGV